MKMLAYICFLSLFLFAGEATLAQNSNFYYYNGTAQYFTDDSMSVNIILADTGDIRNICNSCDAVCTLPRLRQYPLLYPKILERQ